MDTDEHGFYRRERRKRSDGDRVATKGRKDHKGRQNHMGKIMEDKPPAALAQNILAKMSDLEGLRFKESEGRLRRSFRTVSATAERRRGAAAEEEWGDTAEYAKYAGKGGPDVGRLADSNLIQPPNNMRKTWLIFCALSLVLMARAWEATAATNPPTPAVTLEGFKLTGDLSGEGAVFTLTGTARVENSKGGSLELLSGTVALTELSAHPKWRLRAEQDKFVLVFDRAGKFPIQIKFNAAVRQRETLKRVTLLLRGAGEVTRVQGDQVLAWNVEERGRPVPSGADSGQGKGGDGPSPLRRLVIRFNQPQKDQFSVQVQMQTPLGAFPQAADAMQVRPEGATRFAGYFRIVNEGAVRLEVAQASGFWQISPEQFPETDPKEAPLRELLLRVPKGYALARLNASGLSDYFLREPEEQADAELRLVYGQPVTGRQVVQLRLGRNKGLGETVGTLPRVEV